MMLIVAAVVLSWLQLHVVFVGALMFLS